MNVSMCNFWSKRFSPFTPKKIFGVNGEIRVASLRRFLKVIFISSSNEALQSFSMPFHCMRSVTLEQPIFGANYLKGTALAQPGGNWNGEVTWKLTFNRGGCIDFGQALLKANDMGRQLFIFFLKRKFSKQLSSIQRAASICSAGWWLLFGTSSILHSRRWPLLWIRSAGSCVSRSSSRYVGFQNQRSLFLNIV